MPRQKVIILGFVCILFLTGCITREQADARLARGCAAGAENFIGEGVKIKNIEKASFKTSDEFGEGYREVILDVIESDGWHEPAKQYKCVFFEAFGAFNTDHKASIYQVKVDGRIYGKKNGKVIGSFQDNLKLMETVDKVMGNSGYEQFGL